MLRLTNLGCLITAVAVLGLCGLSASAAGLDPPVPNAISWQGGESTLAPQDATEVAAALKAISASGERHALVQFDRPITMAERQKLADGGVRLLNYLGSNAFFASLAPQGVDGTTLSSATPLHAVQPILAVDKLEPSLARGEIMPWAVVSSEKEAKESDVPRVAAYIVFHADVNLEDEGVPLVTLYGAAVRSLLRSVNGAVIELPQDAIESLAAADEVMWIEPPLPKFSELNNSNRVRTEADTAQAAPYGLDGSGVTVLVYDGGEALASHGDFGGRLTVRDSSGVSDHSTHVAGTIGGDGSGSGGLYRGMAPGVIIESYGFEQAGGLTEGFLYSDPGDLEVDYTQAINFYGADISNNSIGTNTAPNGFPCDWEGNYGVTSALIDNIVRGSVS
ncbi:MAG: hypothetical protein JXO22_11150, partial [Phycisphaerae bacterium]|nr:hypothetical protein [Phycisphaerae bacterium]